MGACIRIEYTPSDVEQCDDPAMLRSHEAGEFSLPTNKSQNVTFGNWLK